MGEKLSKINNRGQRENLATTEEEKKHGQKLKSEEEEEEWEREEGRGVMKLKMRKNRKRRRMENLLEEEAVFTKSNLGYYY